MRRLLIMALLTLVCGSAFADAPPPPPGAAALARQPDIVERFLDAALGGPPYYNIFLLPVETGKLARLPDGSSLIFVNWRRLSRYQPPILDEIRSLTGIGPEPPFDSEAFDRTPVLLVEWRNDLKSGLDAADRKFMALRFPYYTATAPEDTPGAGCGVFTMSGHPLRVRELHNSVIRIRRDLPQVEADNCLARVLLRALGLGGRGEYASGAKGPLTEEEKFFLWLAYRLPIGADRETLRRLATEILAGL
ncbi:hypothetical protein L2U69_07480 [Zavarzinia compransoris]|uniref:hypothetical protein n=1 Tax=Zavarzinia marina TaxID=2911065 RepID=UPI001F2715E3|nr:hypothetical protein [Zavarzinia marina]MCF4165479.1 hypothetical protein [Zavarzinia marina]